MQSTRVVDYLPSPVRLSKKGEWKRILTLFRLTCKEQELSTSSENHTYFKYSLLPQSSQPYQHLATHLYNISKVMRVSEHTAI
jgi:hypothetical protein